MKTIYNKLGNSQLLRSFNVVILFLFFHFAFAPLQLLAQEEGEDKPELEIVKKTFEDGLSINNQTTETLMKNNIENIIQHRFGLLEKSDDLFGLYAPSNIRLALIYGITDDISVGIGATKFKRLYDFQWKYKILKQKKGGGSPVTVTYFGNIIRSALPEESFLKSSHRLSYFNQIIISKKIGHSISLQLSPTISHFNVIDTLMQHDSYGISFAGKYRFSPQSSLLFEYDLGITKHKVNVPENNIGIGYEVSTGSHQFQIFVCNATGIMDQEIRVFNNLAVSKNEWVLGFNITRQWGF